MNCVTSRSTHTFQLKLASNHDLCSSTPGNVQSAMMMPQVPNTLNMAPGMTTSTMSSPGMTTGSTQFPPQPAGTASSINPTTMQAG